MTVWCVGFAVTILLLFVVFLAQCVLIAVIHRIADALIVLGAILKTNFDRDEEAITENTVKELKRHIDREREKRTGKTMVDVICEKK